MKDTTQTTNIEFVRIVHAAAILRDGRDSQTKMMKRLLTIIAALDTKQQIMDQNLRDTYLRRAK